MRHYLRKFERKNEIVRRTLIPATNRRRRRYCIECRVYFDRVKGASVDREEISRPGSVRIKHTGPIRIVPTLGSHVEYSGHPLNRYDKGVGVKTTGTPLALPSVIRSLAREEIIGVPPRRDLWMTCTTTDATIRTLTIPGTLGMQSVKRSLAFL